MSETQRKVSFLEKAGPALEGSVSQLRCLNVDDFKTAEARLVAAAASSALNFLHEKNDGNHDSHGDCKA